VRGLLFAVLAVGLGVAAALPSCGSAVDCSGPQCGEVSSSSTAGAAGAGGGVAIDCPKSGVLHGPWSLHFDEKSARVRWDACAPSSAALSVTPESGGAATTVTGTQTVAHVLTSYDTLKNVPPDLPGTYYTTEVNVTGLEPSRCYKYQLVADPARKGRFCTARKAGDPFVFLAMGDTNPAIGDTDGVMASVLGGLAGDAPFAARPDFTAHLGDMQYYASLFESYATWFPAMAPLFEAGALQPAVGNHESEKDHEFDDYYTRLFGGAGFDGALEYYRYQSGGVWFFSLDTEISMKPGSEQANWLEKSLADAAGKPGYRFGVVYFHKPWITLSEYSQDVTARNHFKPLFEKYKVRLVLQGHVHGYERFVDGAITYITSGGGGAALHDLDLSLADRPAEAALRVKSAKRYHATLFSVLADRIEARAVASDATVLDSFAIPLN
jgi:acid phosphatase type 7